MNNRPLEMQDASDDISAEHAIKPGLEPEEPYSYRRAIDPNIDRLEQPIELIMEHLWHRFGRGEYQIIIGDDASGRIPTLIVSGIAKEISQEKGVPAPKTIFFAGFRSRGRDAANIKTEAMVRFVEEHVKNFNAGKTVADNNALPLERALIVTDTIETGRSLEPFVEVLRRLGIKYDIATLGMLGEHKNIARKFTGEIITGGHALPPIYGRRHLGGVKKIETSSDKIFAEPYSEHVFYKKGEYVEERRIVNSARKDVSSIVQNIVHRHKSRE